MAIVAIISQPGSDSIPKVVPAYRPVSFTVQATRTDGQPAPPVVYCDIYFNGTYYKTLSLTQYAKLNATNTDWKFDISDAAQESLKFKLPPNGSSSMQSSPLSIVAVFCRFRSSGYDSNNFLQWEGIAPKQATGSTGAVAGTGTESESFYIINAVLQHEDNQDLLTHLQYARPNGSYNADTYPLTHRPNGYKICKGDSDYFPFMHLGNKVFKKLCVNYRLNGQTGFTQSCFNLPLVCDSVVSNVVCTVQPDKSTLVTFDSSGEATVWEWRLNGSSLWHVIYTKSFIITWNDLLQAIITEAGQEVITEDGEIIIPEDIDIYDVVQNVDVRPRCSNGAYGTTGSGTFSIPTPSVCNPPELFSHNSTSYPTGKILLNITLPAGKTKFQLEWKYAYPGYETSPILQDYTLSGSPFEWIVPAGFIGGSFKLRIRTDCNAVGETGNYSAYSNQLTILWSPPPAEVQVTIQSITSSGGQWVVICELSETLPDQINIHGSFYGDAAVGGVATFMFTNLIPIGALTGTTFVDGAALGGTVYGSLIDSATPNPTTNGKILVYS